MDSTAPQCITRYWQWRNRLDFKKNEWREIELDPHPSRTIRFLALNNRAQLYPEFLFIGKWTRIDKLMKPFITWTFWLCDVLVGGLMIGHYLNWTSIFNLFSFIAIKWNWLLFLLLSSIFRAARPRSSVFQSFTLNFADESNFYQSFPFFYKL
jgi:hypothetical protein